MVRDAAGADWGRYRKEQARQRDVGRLRRKSLPSIYLLTRVRTDLQLFDGFQIEVKVGQTSKSPQLRADARHREGFSLHTYWPCHEAFLEMAEAEILSKMRERFGPPSMGREFFFVPRVSDVHQVICRTMGTEGKEDPG